MKAVLTAIGIGFAVAIIAGLMFLGSVKNTYNSLVTQRTTVERLASDIDAQLQRRADLIPNLVSTTKGAMKQEKAVFENISKAHAAFSNAPQGSNERFNAGTELGSALRGYLVVAQQYPNLASLEIVKDLNANLDGTENRIAVARMRYNEDVEKYNTYLQKFPANLIAGYFKFDQKPFFTVDSQDAKKNPKVDFGE